MYIRVGLFINKIDYIYIIRYSSYLVIWNSENTIKV